MRKAIFIALLAASFAVSAGPKMSVGSIVVPYNAQNTDAALLFGLNGGNLTMIRNEGGAVSAVVGKTTTVEAQNFPRIPYGETYVSNWTAGNKTPCTVFADGKTYRAPYWHSVIVRTPIDDDLLSVEHGGDAYDRLEIHMECTAGTLVR